MMVEYINRKLFVNCFKNISPGDKKIKKRDYLIEGEIPVVDQGEDLIGGYTDDSSKIQDLDLPVVIFGDHTRRFKYINFKFAVGADGVKIIKPDSNILDDKFAFYQLLQIKLPDKGYSRHFQFLTKTDFWVPDNVQFQKKIVEVIETQFTRLDSAVKSLKAIKTKLNLYRKSVLKAAFEGKLSPITELEESVLNDICQTITDGTHLTPQLVSKGIPMLDVKDLDEYFNIWITNPKKFISIETDRELAKRCKPQEDDILISSRGTIGRIGMVKKEQDFNIMGNMILIRVNKEVLNVKYTAFALKFLKYEIDKLARGVAQKGLYLRNVRRFKLKYSKKISEQKEIVSEIESRFSVIDKLEQVIDNALKKSEILRKSILKSAFEGRLVN